MRWFFGIFVLAGVATVVYRDAVERWLLDHRDRFGGRWIPPPSPTLSKISVLAAAAAMIINGTLGLLGLFEPP